MPNRTITLSLGGRCATRAGSMLLAFLLAAPASGVFPTTAAAAEPRTISLEEALREALERSPDLATAASRIAAARAAVVQTQAAFLPTLTVAETYSASDDPVQAFMMTLKQRVFDFGTADFNHPGVVDNLGTRLIGRWQLYNGGRDAATRAAAELGAGAADDEFAAARNRLVFEVTRAFYETLKARRFVAAAVAEVADLENTRSLAERRHSEQTALETDVLDADVRLSLAREDLVRAKSALGVAEAVLTGAVGSTDTDPLTAAEPRQPIGTEASPAPIRTAADLRERPELAAARKALAQAEEGVRAARAGRLPRVSAFAGYDVDTGDLSKFADSWAAGLSVELDVFDGARTSGAIARATAERAAAAAALRRVEIELGLELRRAQFGIDEATARIAATASAARLAERSLEITRERYSQGLALFSQVLDAETALTRARQRKDAAAMDYPIAVAALDAARGTGRSTDPSDSAQSAASSARPAKPATPEVTR